MPDFVLTLDASAIFSSNAPTLEILLDGIVVDSDQITTSTGFGTSSYSYSLSYTGGAPGSLSFRFNDGSGEAGRSITIGNVQINGYGVKVSQMLLAGSSSNEGGKITLENNGDSSSLDMATQSFVFTADETEPTLSDFDPLTHSGTAGIDNITGTAGNDVIDLGAGDDVTRAGDGDDQILGGDGNDKLIAEGGNDIIAGGAGDDRFYAGDGNDVIYGGAGDDVAVGEAGDDILYGNDGKDRLHGDDGADQLYGGAGNDRLDGDAGDDYIHGGDDNDKLYGSSGNDTIFGGNGHDDIYGEADDDYLDGNDGIDFIDGGLGDDVIVGGSGNDTLRGDAGADVIHGDAGRDLIYGGSEDDIIDGGLDDDLVYGDEGVDNIVGGAGNDRLFGGEGNDTISGGNGSDFVYGDAGDDYLTAGAGLRDELYGGDGNDTMYGGVGFNKFFGGAGNDVMYGDSDVDVIRGDDGDDLGYGYAGDDILVGGAGNDTMWGGDDNDILRGNDDDDLLYGEAGDDEINGGAGNDLIDGSTGTDIAVYTSAVTGGVTVDLTISGAQDTINAGIDTLVSIENIRGSLFADTLTGDSGVNEIYGQDGNDSIYGGGGADILDGGLDDDIIYGHSATGIVTISDEDFEGGATGWNNNTTDSAEAAEFTEFLGRVAGNTAQNLFKTYSSIPEGDITISVDVYQIDSWDTEDFMIYINDTEILVNTFQGGNNAGNGNGTFTGGSWTRTSLDTNIFAFWEGQGWTEDSIYRYEITLDNYSLANLKLGFGSDAIQGIADESFGIDNVLITSTPVSGLVDGGDTIDGGEGNDTLYGQGGSDVINGGLGNDTIYAYDSTVQLASATVSATVTEYSVDFAAGTDGFVYVDSNDPGNVTVTGSHNTGDGNTANGSLEVDIDSSNGSWSNAYGFYTETITFSQNLQNAELSFFYRHIHSNQNDTGEDSQVFFDIDGGSIDQFISTASGGSGTVDTGWVQHTVNLGDVSAGDTFDLLLGIVHWGANRNNEDATVRFDDVTITGDIQTTAPTANTQDLGESNIINGGEGNDTIYGSAGNDTLYSDGGNDTIYSASADEAWDAAIANILANNAGVVYSEDTNSFYQVVSSTVDWTVANAAANSATLTGLSGVNGHLATITSAAEQTFLEGQTSGISSWLGGGDFTSEGVWTWTTGPEAGMQFSGATGNSVNGAFTSWTAGQPNDSDGTQDYLYMLNGADWADLVNEGDGSTGFVTVDQYIIEWDASALISTVGVTILNGGSGTDTLYGNDGIDIFDFDAIDGSVDIIESFSLSGHDAVDISDILSGYGVNSNISDFVNLSESGGNTTISVSAGGTGSGYVDIAQINGVTGLDLNQMIAAENLIV